MGEAMGDVRQWLDQIGLPQCAEVFEREQIDLVAARDLSDADLKELGLPLGCVHIKLLSRFSAGATRMPSGVW